MCPASCFPASENAPPFFFIAAPHSRRFALLQTIISPARTTLAAYIYLSLAKYPQFSLIFFFFCRRCCCSPLPLLLSRMSFFRKITRILETITDDHFAKQVNLPTLHALHFQSSVSMLLVFPLSRPKTETHLLSQTHPFLPT